NDDRDTWYVAVGDVSGDGKLDIVEMNSGDHDPTKTATFYLNDGTGGFPTATELGPPNSDGMVMLGDVNSDGRLDIVEWGNAALVVLINGGSNNFSDVTSLPTGGSAAFGDMDGDGYLDIVQSSPFGAQGQIYLNDKQGHFSNFAAFGSPATSYGVAVAD